MPDDDLLRLGRLAMSASTNVDQCLQANRKFRKLSMEFLSSKLPCMTFNLGNEADMKSLAIQIYNYAPDTCHKVMELVAGEGRENGDALARDNVCICFGSNTLMIACTDKWKDSKKESFRKKNQGNRNFGKKKNGKKKNGKKKKASGSNPSPKEFSPRIVCFDRCLAVCPKGEEDNVIEEICEATGMTMSQYNELLRMLIEFAAKLITLNRGDRCPAMIFGAPAKKAIVSIGLDNFEYADFVGGFNPIIESKSADQETPDEDADKSNEHDESDDEWNKAEFVEFDDNDLARQVIHPEAYPKANLNQLKNCKNQDAAVSSFAKDAFQKYFPHHNFDSGCDLYTRKRNRTLKKKLGIAFDTEDEADAARTLLSA